MGGDWACWLLGGLLFGSLLIVWAITWLLAQYSDEEMH